MPKPDQCVICRDDLYLEFRFRYPTGHVKERRVRVRGDWWIKLVIMLEQLVMDGHGEPFLSLGRWEVRVPGNRAPVGYS